MFNFSRLLLITFFNLLFLNITYSSTLELTKAKCNLWGTLKLTISDGDHKETFKKKLKRSDCKKLSSILKQEIRNRTDRPFNIKQDQEIVYFDHRSKYLNLNKSAPWDSRYEAAFEQTQCDIYELTHKYLTMSFFDEDLTFTKNTYRLLRSYSGYCHHKLKNF